MKKMFVNLGSKASEIWNAPRVQSVVTMVTTIAVVIVVASVISVGQKELSGALEGLLHSSDSSSDSPEE